MEKSLAVRGDIFQLIAVTFGVATAKQFQQSYIDATLPIYTDGAKKILEVLLGPPKTHEKLNQIYAKNNMEHSYV